jgi:hypothetical protein
MPVLIRSSETAGCGATIETRRLSGGWRSPSRGAAIMKKPTKPQCETAIGQMFNQWRLEPAQQDIAEVDLSYSKFRAWADQKGYSSYFKFRSVMGPEEDAERWFAQRFRQTWKY